MNGLLVKNDKGNVQISSDVTPLSSSHMISRDFKVDDSLLPLANEDGTFSVWHRPDATSRLEDIGIFQAFYDSPIYMAKRRSDQSDILQVEKYVFTPKPAASSRAGLQMFNASGIETFNSDQPLLSIIDKVSINVVDAYDKDIKRDSYTGNLWMDRTFWLKDYPGYSKLGLLFTNVPGGIAKTKDFYQIWAYFYNFRTAGSLVEFAYRAEYWSWSGSSAVIELDLDLKLEFFVVDLSNV